MRRLILSSVVVVLLAPTLASAQDRDKSKEQVEFGIKVAQSNLWNEALYRWEKATQLDPTYAAAWNNLWLTASDNLRDRHLTASERGMMSHA